MRISIGIIMLFGLTQLNAIAQTIEEHSVELSHVKTIHLIFPKGIKYVDLGSLYIIAGKADHSENVLRVKAAIPDFPGETNFSVITDDGAFYSFTATYNENPDKLNFTLATTQADPVIKLKENLPSGVIFEKDGEVTYSKVIDNAQRLYHDNKRYIKNIASKKNKITVLLKDVAVCGDYMIFIFDVINYSNISYELDYIRTEIKDTKKLKRVTLQRHPIDPVFQINHSAKVHNGAPQTILLVYEKLTLPDKKKLDIDFIERSGARHMNITIRNRHLIKARKVNN